MQYYGISLLALPEQLTMNILRTLLYEVWSRKTSMGTVQA